jgi:hypothetical protein
VRSRRRLVAVVVEDQAAPVDVGDRTTPADPHLGVEQCDRQIAVDVLGTQPVT